jgi:SAM-dependent methyltransferase
VLDCGDPCLTARVEGLKLANVNEYYNTYWSSEGFKPTGHSWPELLDFFSRYLPSTAGRVLDVGCGDGLTTGPAVQAAGHEYLGADVSETGVASARANGFEALLIEGADRLPLADRSIATITCIEVLEHLFAPQDAIREFWRVLEPGGLLLATTPNVAYWRSRANLLLLGRFDPIGDSESVSRPWRDPHIRFFTPNTLASMAHEAGFESVVVEGQRGGFLNGLPWLPHYRTSRQSSTVYKAMQQRWPSALAYGNALVARKATQ